MGSAVSVPQKSQTIAQMEGTWHKLEKEPTGLWRLIGRFVYKEIYFLLFWHFVILANMNRALITKSKNHANFTKFSFLAIIVAALFAAPKILSISVEKDEKLAFSRTKGGIFRRSKNQIIDLR